MPPRAAGRRWAASATCTRRSRCTRREKGREGRVRVSGVRTYWLRRSEKTNGCIIPGQPPSRAAERLPLPAPLPPLTLHKVCGRVGRGRGGGVEFAGRQVLVWRPFAFCLAREREKKAKEKLLCCKTETTPVPTCLLAPGARCRRSLPAPETLTLNEGSACPPPAPVSMPSNTSGPTPVPAATFYSVFGL